jgi:excinuclease UvrABC ATPase subunit
MQFATPSPCVRCKKTLVKPGGITGMCKACRAIDPVMAEVQRQNHAAMKVQMRQWLDDNFEPDPRFPNPGLGGAIAVRPKKGSKLW